MTNSPVTFGFLTAPMPARDVAELEAMCFDTLWVGGHVASRNPSPEAIVQLARLLSLTSRVRVGTSVVALPLYPPAIVAKQIADLDRFSEGRVTLGVGIGGEYPREFDACGVPLAERGPRTDEAIPLIRRLWSAEPVGHAGRFYPMSNVRIHPSPVQRPGPPIVVAGRKTPAMRRAALLGEGWMPYLYSPERYARSVQQIREFAASAGRELAGFHWNAFVFVNAQADGSKARAEAAGFLGGMFTSDVAPLLDRVAAAGTPAEVAVRLEEFVAAGARHILIAPAAFSNPVTHARYFADEVAPLLAL